MATYWIKGERLSWDDTHWVQHGQRCFDSEQQDPSWLSTTTCQHCRMSWATRGQTPACTCTLPRRTPHAVPLSVGDLPIGMIEPDDPPPMRDERYGPPKVEHDHAWLFWVIVLLCFASVFAKLWSDK